MAFETIRSASGVDFIGTDEADVLVAFNETGAIFVNGRKADDTVRFNQNISGVLSTATVYGGEGDDIIDTPSAVSSSTINGNKGEDTLDAGFLAQTFFDGGADDDDLIAFEGASSSTIRGSKGNDVLDLFGSITSSLINGNENNDDINLGTDDEFVDETSLTSTVVYGGADADTIDVAFGTSFENTTINGNKGLDVITLRTQVVDGVTKSVIANGLTIFGGEGTDTINAQGATTSAGKAASLYLSGDLGNDSIIAGDGADSIIGGDGNDTVVAGKGADLIEGGAGNDNLKGEDANDTITGGDGNDEINGGGGANRLIGGDGADTFESTADSTDTFIIEAISNSAATVTGKVQEFDTFGANVVIRDGFDKLNISAVASTLAGGRITDATEVDVNNTLIGDLVVADFAALKAQLDNVANVLGSNSQLVQAYTFEANINNAGFSTYLWINDNQKAYNQGDLMFNFGDGGDVDKNGIIIS